MDSHDIVAAINRGEVDANLGDIERAVAGRKKRAFTPGAEFTLKNLSPTYMVGVRVTVMRVNQKRIAVKIDPEWVRNNPGKRFATDEPVTVTADMLEPVPVTV